MRHPAPGPALRALWLPHHWPRLGGKWHDLLLRPLRPSPRRRRSQGPGVNRNRPRLAASVVVQLPAFAETSPAFEFDPIQSSGQPAGTRGNQREADDAKDDARNSWHQSQKESGDDKDHTNRHNKDGGGRAIGALLPVFV